MDAKDFIFERVSYEANRLFSLDTLELDKILQDLCCKYLRYCPAKSQNMGEFLDTFRKAVSVSQLKNETKERQYFEQALQNVIKSNCK